MGSLCERFVLRKVLHVNWHKSAIKLDCLIRVIIIILMVIALLEYTNLGINFLYFYPNTSYYAGMLMATYTYIMLKIICWHMLYNRQIPKWGDLEFSRGQYWGLSMGVGSRVDVPGAGAPHLMITPYKYPVITPPTSEQLPALLTLISHCYQP